MQSIELMAPAGSMEALKAAVAGGADSVYFGGRQFNAREGATNFTRDEIIDAVNYAHERGVRVYVTVNILLTKEELIEAMEFIYFLGKIRVDGIIVQDLGLAGLVRCLLPELPLVGSTQMTVTNALGARYLQQQGFKRVVLARELSLNDIVAIRNQVDLELEAFAHGALCFSYSGQCLFSSIVGGRSGNRGRCAQPCRLAYTLVDAEGRPVENGNRAEHLLSTRDLFTLDRIPQLISAGINALKIEGRMRRPEYVAVVTRAYRQVIDRYLCERDKFKVYEKEKRDVAQIFNRDFTHGYLEGNPGAELMSYGRPSNRGIYLGRAGQRRGLLFPVRLEAPLQKGDGLDIWISRGGHEGIVVHSIIRDGREVNSAPAGTMVYLALPAATKTGDRIFKTSDAGLMAEIRRTFTSDREDGRIALTMWVTARPGEYLKLVIKDEDDNTVEVQSTVKAEIAESRPLNDKVLKKQLGRLGNTPFFLKSLVSEIEGAIMLPLSELNRVRREAVEKLLRKRRESWPLKTPSEKKFKASLKNLLLEEERKKSLVPGMGKKVKIPVLAVAAGDYQGARAALEAGAGCVYIGGEVWQGNKTLNKKEWDDLVEIAREKEAEVIPALPRFWHEEEAAFVARYLQVLVELGAGTILVSGLGDLELLKKHNVAGWGDYHYNVFNIYSFKFLTFAGLKGVTLSPELNLEQLREMSPASNMEIIVHGSLPLMISAHCVPGARLGKGKNGKKCTGPCCKESFGLKDRLGLIFPAGMDNRCRFYLYNSKDICMIDHLDKIARLGIGRIRVEARNRLAGYISKITELYKKVLAALGTADEKDMMAEALEKAEELAPAGITRGHYFRGVV